MKILYRIFVLTVITLLFSQVASSQYAERERDSIFYQQFGNIRPIKALVKTSILPVFYWQIPYAGEYRLVGEFSTGSRSSFLIGGSYLTRSLMFVLSQKLPVNSGNTPVQMNGYRVQVAYRYYFVSQDFRPEGLFISLHSSFASVATNFKGYTDDKQYLEHFNVNLLLGGQVIAGNKVCIEGFIGPGFKNNSYLDRARNNYGVFAFDQFMPVLYKHFKFTLGMNIGIAL